MNSSPLPGALRRPRRFLRGRDGNRRLRSRRTPDRRLRGGRGPLRRSLVAVPLAVVVLAAAAPAARAGSYVVVGCADMHTALTARHTVRATDGWFFAAGGPSSVNECAKGWLGRGLYSISQRGSSLYRFDAPPGTTIVRLVATYRVHLPAARRGALPAFVVEAAQPGRWSSLAPARVNAGSRPVDFSASARAADAARAIAVRIGVRCGPVEPCTYRDLPWSRVHAVAVQLTDDHAPMAGLRVPGGHVRGEIGVDVRASDEGGGVFERRLDLDGAPLARARLCAMVPATTGAVRHFERRVPCPLNASSTVGLDTRALADGPHALAARVEDVAGSVRTAAGSLLVDNRPPEPGEVRLAADAEALTAEPVGFRGQGVAYAYRWERCFVRGCTEIAGARGRAYPLRADDGGRRIRAVVTATDGGGTVEVASAPSAAIPGAATRLSAWLDRAGRRGRGATVTWPARVRVRGRVTDEAGRPLAGAPVRVLERVDGGRWHAVGGLSTLRDGRLSMLTSAGPSRRIRLAVGGTSRTLELRVHAAVRLRVRRLRGGLTLLSGRVPGGHVPRAGLWLLLQSHGASGGWRTRARLHSDGLGRFTATGRAPAGARLRVVVPAQRGYPFLPGASR
jgi:hypothetical protein